MDKTLPELVQETRELYIKSVSLFDHKIDPVVINDNYHDYEEIKSAFQEAIDILEDDPRSGENILLSYLESFMILRDKIDALADIQSEIQSSEEELSVMREEVYLKAERFHNSKNDDYEDYETLSNDCQEVVNLLNDLKEEQIEYLKTHKIGRAHV